MTKQQEYKLSRSDLCHIRDALDSADREFDILEYDNEWYCSDTKDLLLSARYTVYTLLGQELPENLDKEEEDDD